MVFGNGTASTDAQHVVVEFVHPVIMGKRALPAISLTADVATVTGIAGTEGFDGRPRRPTAAPCLRPGHRAGHLPRWQLQQRRRGTGCRPGAGHARPLRWSAATAAAIGLLRAADHIVVAHSDDPQVVKEAHVTAYHVLWELVHVFFEHPDLLEPRAVA